MPVVPVVAKDPPRRRAEEEPPRRAPQSFVLANCACGGDPVLSVFREGTLHLLTLGFADKVALKRGDVVEAWCEACDGRLEIKEIVC